MAPPGTSVSDGQGRAGWQTEKDVVWDEIVVNNKLVWLEINIYNIACPVAINIGPSSPSPAWFRFIGNTKYVYKYENVFLGIYMIYSRGEKSVIFLVSRSLIQNITDFSPRLYLYSPIPLLDI